MVEFEENFNGEEDVKLDTDRVFEVRKRFLGVTKDGNKWRARIKHPKLKCKVSLGYYSTPEEAALVVNKKKAEFEEMFKDENSSNVVELEEKFNCKEDLKLDTNGASEVRKRFLGVSKKGNKWRARIQHPKLKFEVSLGSYSTPEEAALVVIKKKTEFEEMFKGESSMNVDDFEGRKLPPGVYRTGYQRWCARLRHPKYKYKVSLGSYDTPEEAAIVVENKRAEFLSMDGLTPKVKPDWKESKENECPLEKPSSGARIRDPNSSARILLGNFNTAVEVVKSLNKGKAQLAIEREMAEFDRLQFRPKTNPGFKACEDPLKIECADSSNIACIIDKFESKFVPCSLTSVYEPENSNSTNVGDAYVTGKENDQKSGCVFYFEEATSLGFINEYGQLVGEYSNLDEQMSLSVADEDTAEAGCY